MSNGSNSPCITPVVKSDVNLFYFVKRKYKYASPLVDREISPTISYRAAFHQFKKQAMLVLRQQEYQYHSNSSVSITTMLV